MFIGLDGPRAILLWWTLPAYLTLIGAAILLSGGIVLWQIRQSWHLSHAADSVLLAILLGLVFARLEHVVLNWTYFSDAPSEIMTLSAGGLDAHGAVLGAGFGGWIASRLFRSDYRTWLGTAAFALPLIALAAWWGCAATSCAYGAEIGNLSDYPSWLVWEAQGDFLTVAPRYAVQPLGVIATTVMLGLIICSAAFGLRGRRRVGIALAGVMLISFILGFLRGDAALTLANLRMTQWLDLVFFAAGALLTVSSRRMSGPAP